MELFKKALIVTFAMAIVGSDVSAMKRAGEITTRSGKRAKLAVDGTYRYGNNHRVPAKDLPSQDEQSSDVSSSSDSDTEVIVPVVEQVREPVDRAGRPALVRVRDMQPVQDEDSSEEQLGGLWNTLRTPFNFIQNNIQSVNWSLGLFGGNQQATTTEQAEPAEESVENTGRSNAMIALQGGSLVLTTTLSYDAFATAVYAYLGYSGATLTVVIPGLGLVVAGLYASYTIGAFDLVDKGITLLKPQLAKLTTRAPAQDAGQADDAQSSNESSSEDFVGGVVTL